MGTHADELISDLSYKLTYLQSDTYICSYLLNISIGVFYWHVKLNIIADQ